MKRLLGLMILLPYSMLLADSGLIRVSQVQGPFRITIMTDPTPIRVGEVDIAVLVQNAETGTTQLDVDVTMECEQEDGLRMLVDASRNNADNQLLYAAKFTLPASGLWHVQTTVRDHESASMVEWSFNASGPLPPLAKAWPWLLPAPIGIACYAINRRLRRPPS